MSTDSLSVTLAALADPTRRAILAQLAQGEATVTELAEPFEMSLPAKLSVIQISRSILLQQVFQRSKHAV